MSTPVRGVSKEDRSEVQQTNIVRSQVSVSIIVTKVAASLSP